MHPSRRTWKCCVTLDNQWWLFGADNNFALRSSTTELQKHCGEYCSDKHVMKINTVRHYKHKEQSTINLNRPIKRPSLCIKAGLTPSLCSVISHPPWPFIVKTNSIITVGCPITSQAYHALLSEYTIYIMGCEGSNDTGVI